ncbi:DNA polymerase III subunit beta [Heliophilum fasciatum]|uniref:Beta sliding clamp n=1 Tax=Heliophilum fasciatum TaxID=35700 RepID=A0A4R2RNM1_9FIRM|nr:DNA polymerase III subunit beta [Heliophilum fasciatum]MCW2278284.1 DNA polymerase-3 subunit beta [Heliophilum fasciatum]TCP63907.1 DNA polymerase III beta subunit [Heliophilum fasciatum]
MEFTCSRPELLEGVNAVIRAVSSKPQIPVLSGIYMETNDHVLRLVATDMEIGIEYKIPVQTNQSGATVVNARVFNEMVRRLPDSPVMFSTAGDHAALKVRYHGSEVTLNTMNPQEFPLLPTILDGDRVTLKASNFKEMTRLVSFAASTDEARPWFTGVLWDFHPDGLRWVATDTHRLAMLVGEVVHQQIAEPRQLILHGKTLSDVAKLLDDDDQELHMIMTSSQVLLEADRLRVILRIIDGQYPKYQQVIPREWKTRITISVKALSEAVDRASLASIGKEGSNIVKLSMDKDSLQIRSNSPEVGHIYEEVWIDMQGEPIPIAFNYRYLQEALRVIGGDQVYLDLSGTLVPGVLRPLQDERYLYLIVPVRTV